MRSESSCASISPCRLFRGMRNVAREQMFCSYRVHVPGACVSRGFFLLWSEGREAARGGAEAEAPDFIQPRFIRHTRQICVPWAWSTHRRLRRPRGRQARRTPHRGRSSSRTAAEVTARRRPRGLMSSGAETAARSARAWVRSRTGWWPRCPVYIHTHIKRSTRRTLRNIGA